MPLCLKDRIGLNVPPLLLRFMLGVIFVWAGLGKVSSTFEVAGGPAAVLANMGALTPPSLPTIAPKAEPPAAPESKPVEPKPAETKPGGGARIPDAPGVHLELVRQQTPAKTYSAADFPTPVHVRQLYGLALMLHGAAAPEGGAMPLWPAALATGSMPVYLAWAVTVTELAGGIFLLLGLLTRIAAFGIAGVMLGAIWLTEIGPAVQSGKTVLGFLPDRPPFDQAWQMLTLQFALCAAALALAFCGPGRLSLDTALLSGRGDDDDED